MFPFLIAIFLPLAAFAAAPAKKAITPSLIAHAENHGAATFAVKYQHPKLKVTITGVGELHAGQTSMICEEQSKSIISSIEAAEKAGHRVTYIPEVSIANLPITEECSPMHKALHHLAARSSALKHSSIVANADRRGPAEHALNQLALYILDGTELENFLVIHNGVNPFAQLQTDLQATLRNFDNFDKYPEYAVVVKEIEALKEFSLEKLDDPTVLKEFFIKCKDANFAMKLYKTTWKILAGLGDLSLLKALEMGIRAKHKNIVALWGDRHIHFIDKHLPRYGFKCIGRAGSYKNASELAYLSAQELEKILGPVTSSHPANSSPTSCQQSTAQTNPQSLPK